MKKLRRLIPRTMVTLALIGSLASARADQLIVENFNQVVADNSPIGLATGWYAVAIAGGTLNDYTTSVPAVTPANYPTMSRAAGGGLGGITGCAVMGAFNFATTSFFWTNTTTSLDDATITNIVFYTKNNANTSTERLVIQISNDWYATTNVFRDNGGNSIWFTNTFVFTRAATSWQLFDTNTLTFGAGLSSPLPEGDVVAVGIYGAMPVTGKIRLDSFSVNGLPPGPPFVPAPVITPANSVTAPTTVTLTVNALGTGPLGYHWRKNGIEINDGPSGTGSTRSGTTTNQLVISTTSPSDSGQYDLVVTNTYGATTSSVANVTVNAQVIPPSIVNITVNPPSQTSEVGGAPMTILVAADGTGPLHYQWRKGNVDIAGETNTLLTLASAFTNAGSYIVVVTNIAGSITNTPPVVLTVVDTTAPTITFPEGLTNYTAIHSVYVPIYSTSDNSGEPVTVAFAGMVNTNALGTYSLNYYASDPYGNTNAGTLTVNVVLIAERFDESTIDNGIVSQAPGWHAMAKTVPGGVVTDYTTAPNPPINANYPTLSKNTGNPGVFNLPGYLVMGDVTVANPSLIWKDTTVLLQGHQLTNLTFYSKNNDPGSQVYIAIHVGTNWYASTTTFSDTTYNTNWAPHSFAFSTDASAWQLLDVSTLTLGSPLSEPFPNLSVAAIGFYGTMTLGKIRLDEFRANGTPAVFPPTPPEVTQPTASPLNPVDGTAWTGTPLTIQATAGGTQPLTYQWRRNGGDLAGATTNQFVLNSPTSSDSGDYELVVANAGGTVTSAVLTVTVSSASLLRSERFNESSVDPGVVSQAPGWHALAADLTNGNVVTDFTLLPNPPTSLNYPNLSLSAGSDGTPGYLVAGQADTVNPVLLWLDTTALLQNTAPTNLSVYTRNNFPSATFQVAIRLAGQWYASTTLLSDTTLNANPWALQTFTFIPDAGAWQSLDISTLALGDVTSSSLNLSNATAVGFYCNMSVGRMRFDEFRLTAIATVAPPAPQPTIQPVFVNGNNLVLRTLTVAGRNYVLESTPSLTTPITWTPVLTNTGNGAVITNAVPMNPANPRGFFRYHVQ